MSLFVPYEVNSDVCVPNNDAQDPVEENKDWKDHIHLYDDNEGHKDEKSASSGEDNPNAGKIVHAHWSRCPHCYVSISTLGTEPPTVCPYCRRALDQYGEDREMAKPIAPPSKEEVAQRIHNIYNKPSPVIVILLAAIALFILGWAVYEQIISISDFWYKGVLVAVYSMIAGLFVITRFIFAAFYQAPPDVGYEPTLTVLIPCFNEGEAIRKTIERIFAAGYPEEKLEVICVNDGSKDDSLHHMLAAQTLHPHLVVVNFEKNRGLCHGWGVATFLARGEFMICVDSDTFVFPGSLKKMMQGFIDPRVGGISGHCDVENAHVNLLTKLQDVRYYFSYKIMKAAESVFGTVSCLPGCFSAYRRTCVLAVMDKWINATVLGEHGNFADDRSLTNQILRDYRIVYDDEALATTIAPEGWKQYIRQQARWERSYLREIWKTGKFIWRKHPVPAISWYAMMWLPLVEPFVMLQALAIIPIQNYIANIPNGFWVAMREALLTPRTFIIGVMSITAVWSIHFWATTGRKWWWGGFAFTVSYIVFFSWQIYWALFTLRGKKWGTRG